MAKLTKAQRRVMDCLNADGHMQANGWGDYRLSDGGLVRDCTVAILRMRGLIRFIPNDGPRGTFYAEYDHG